MKNIKKSLIILVSCLILIALVGCNKKSEESQKADDLIIAIGNVSKESGRKIEDAEFYYSMLSDKQKEQVEHYDYLLQAREEYDKLANFRTVPDISGKTEDEIIKMMEEADVLYNFTYDYDISVPKGYVIFFTPRADREIESDKVVEIHISKGERRIHAKDSLIGWQHLNRNKPDEWHLGIPYIQEEETIYMECTATFGTPFEYNGVAEASTTESFDKSCPAKVLFSSNEVKAGDKQNVILSVPIKSLGEDQPTNVCYKIYVKSGGADKVINVNFSMNW